MPEGPQLGVGAVAVALELGEELPERGREQPQHRAPGRGDQAARRTRTRRDRGGGEGERCQRRFARGLAQPVEETDRVPVLGRRAQNAPLRLKTTGTVRARTTRSSQIDHVSM